MIAFGPVPSRRLGQSLGINNIPPKNCSYDCIYCQVGPTAHKDLNRRHFYEPDVIIHAIKQKVQAVKAANNSIDYLSLVPDGEPTLDIHLGKIIDMLRTLEIKIAVITNSSLMWREDVRSEIAKADYVSMKMDAVIEDAWRKVNRPNPKLSLTDILKGALAFSKAFKGTLVTETMLVHDINDNEGNLKATAEYLEKLNPSIAYIAIPTRPPSESWVQMPDEQTLNLAYQIFNSHVNKTEFLTGFSEEAFLASENVIQELLNITSVHPMRESEAVAFFKQGKIDKTKLDDLVIQEKLVRVIHDGQPFYIRKLHLGDTVV